MDYKTRMSLDQPSCGTMKICPLVSNKCSDKLLQCPGTEPIELQLLHPALINQFRQAVFIFTHEQTFQENPRFVTAAHRCCPRLSHAKHLVIHQVPSQLVCKVVENPQVPNGKFLHSELLYLQRFCS